MSGVLASVIATVNARLSLVGEAVEGQHAHLEVLALVEQARQEWEAAQGYFDNVSDPDLIDHAVYVNQAAEKRYMYLLKQARTQGIQANSLLRSPLT